MRNMQIKQNGARREGPESGARPHLAHIPVMYILYQERPAAFCGKRLAFCSEKGLRWTAVVREHIL